MVVEPYIRRDPRARHVIVQKAAREELPGGVVDAVLARDLPDALNDAAVELPFEQHVIQDPPAIVDRGVVQDGERPGVRVDLDLRDVRTAGK